MSSNQPIISVVIKDKHSVNLYDAAKNGVFLKNIFITNGEIVSAPIVAGDTCTITCLEKGRTCIRTYSLPRFTFKNIFYPN